MGSEWRESWRGNWKALGQSWKEGSPAQFELEGAGASSGASGKELVELPGGGGGGG